MGRYNCSFEGRLNYGPTSFDIETDNQRLDGYTLCDVGQSMRSNEEAM